MLGARQGCPFSLQCVLPPPHCDSAPAYFVAKNLAGLPFSVLTMLVYSWVVYGMAGFLRTPAALFQHVVLQLLLSLIASQVRGHGRKIACVA